MPETDSQRYHNVCQHARQTAALASIDALLGWDERTQMPAAGAEHRATQTSLIAGMAHRRWVDPEFGESLLALAASPLAADPQSDAAVNIRRLKRQYDRKIKLPQSLVEELARTAVLGQQSWQEARQKNDFAAFRPWLQRTFELKRQQADALGYEHCRYDALLDEFEPDGLTANVAPVLAGLRAQLVPLVAEIQQTDRRPNVAFLHERFPIGVQDSFGRRAAAAIGFDFERGRLDVTAHPFCTQLGPHDHRITTRFDERFFNAAFFGILHEAGHGLYEQGLPPAHYGLPLGEAVSLGIHESQSRMWENFVGRSHAFWKHFYPSAQECYPHALAGVPLDEFYLAINEVRPSLIRVEADEATYNLHIVVRFELEQALLADEVKVADLPAAWNDLYEKQLGIVPPNDHEGVLQDVHWSAGLIGYFPTYALGNLYAAQFFAQAKSELPDLDEQFARGDFHPLLSWLRENIHRHGQRYSAAELVERATGRPLSAGPLIEHLSTKLRPLYGLR
jgi:carboxypeptidase Taq